MIAFKCKFSVVLVWERTLFPYSVKLFGHFFPFINCIVAVRTTLKLVLDVQKCFGLCCGAPNGVDHSNFDISTFKSMLFS